VIGVTLGAGLLGLVAGCGGTTTTTSPTTSPTSAAAGQPGGSTPDTSAGAEYTIVPAAEVTAGLTEVRAMAAGIKATLATNQTDAVAQVRTMYDRWFEFEGTVRKNDKDLYLQMEDGLAAIKAGAEQNRADKVDKGLKDLEAGASAYLVRFP
jgi:hypothetical protein